MEPVKISDESGHMATLYIDHRATIFQVKLVIAENCAIPVEEIFLKRSTEYVNDAMNIGDIPRPVDLEFQRRELDRSVDAVEVPAEVETPATSKSPTRSLETSKRAVTGAEIGVLTAIGIAAFPSACLGFCTRYLSCLCTPCCGHCMETCCLGVRNFIVRHTRDPLAQRIVHPHRPAEEVEHEARSAASDGVFFISTTVLALPLIPPLALTGGLLGACAGLTFDTAGGCTKLQADNCTAIVLPSSHDAIDR